MKYNFNISFPKLTFTSPGVYSYTVKELTPSDENWRTDDRIYRVIVTVTDDGDGGLTASLTYPDGFPRFVNKYSDCPPPPPPVDKCKYFNCLPFPMFWFMPPQKPEFDEIMRTKPDTFEWWNNMLKHLNDGNGRD